MCSPWSLTSKALGVDPRKFKWICSSSKLSPSSCKETMDSFPLYLEPKREVGFTTVGLSSRLMAPSRSMEPPSKVHFAVDYLY